MQTIESRTYRKAKELTKDLMDSSDMGHFIKMIRDLQLSYIDKSFDEVLKDDDLTKDRLKYMYTDISNSIYASMELLEYSCNMVSLFVKSNEESERKNGYKMTDEIINLNIGAN